MHCRCGAEMGLGLYIAQTMTRGVLDFPGDEGIGPITLSLGGPGRLATCLKCPECGRSVTSERTE